MAEQTYWTIYSVWEEEIDGRKVLRATPESFEDDDTGAMSRDAVARIVESRRARSPSLKLLGPYEVTYDPDIPGKAHTRDRSVSAGDVSAPPEGFFTRLRNLNGNTIDSFVGSSSPDGKEER